MKGEPGFSTLWASARKRGRSGSSLRDCKHTTASTLLFPCIIHSSAPEFCMSWGHMLAFCRDIQLRYMYSKRDKLMTPLVHEPASNCCREEMPRGCCSESTATCHQHYKGLETMQICATMKCMQGCQGPRLVIGLHACQGDPHGCIDCHLNN